MFNKQTNTQSLDPSALAKELGGEFRLVAVIESGPKTPFHHHIGPTNDNEFRLTLD